MGGGVSKSAVADELARLTQSKKKWTDILDTIEKKVMALREDPVKCSSSILLSKECGLLDWFVSVLNANLSNPNNLDKILAVLIWVPSTNVVVYDDELHSLDYTCSNECGLIEVIMKIWKSTRSDVMKWSLGYVVGIIGKFGSAQNCQLMIHHGIHSQVLSGLVGYTGEIKNTYKEYTAKYSDIIVNLARHDIISNAMKAAGTKDIFLPIIANRYSRVSGLKAFLIMVCLYGKDETNSQAGDFMKLRPDAMDLLLEAFDLIIAERHASDYGYGTFTLKLVVNAFLFLATSDAKRDLLIRTSLLTNLRKSLNFFIENKAPLRCTAMFGTTAGGCAGGGGSDVEGAELIVATLLQLSFAYESDADLQEQYMTPDSGILAQFQALCSCANYAKFSDAAKRNVESMKFRLTKRAAPVEVPVVTTAVVQSGANTTTHVAANNAIISKPSHIMISYCWASAARPELVNSLCREFKQMGYDVWKDTEGSSLVPPMSGSTDERMAEALEAASILIICVSKEYKESANCRMEAKYASQLSKKGKLSIFFVMMQNEYTTVSVPNSCDGWLGIMIGDAMWFSLWDAGLVGTTSKAIAQNIKDKCKLTDNLAFAAAAAGNNTSASNQSAATEEHEAPMPTATLVEDHVSESAASTAHFVAPAEPAASKSPEKDTAKEPVSYSAAWEFLNTPARVTSVEEVTAALDRLGILEPDDLRYFPEADVLRELVPLLKKAQQLRFLGLMQINAN